MGGGVNGVPLIPYAQSQNLYRPVASQPGGGGVWTWMGGTPGAPPPLGHCPRDVINLKNAPTLGHSQAPPPPWTLSSALRKIGKRPPLGHSQAPPPLGHCPCDVIHIFQGWNKIAKGWNKIAKGWNKIFGMGNWGGRPTPPPRPPPPTPPPGYGPAIPTEHPLACRQWRS